MYFNIIKTIHEKSTTNIILNDEKLKKCPLRLGTTLGWPLLPRLFNSPIFYPVSCSMSSSNCCFLTCIEVSRLKHPKQKMVFRGKALNWIIEQSIIKVFSNTIHLIFILVPFSTLILHWAISEKGLNFPPNLAVNLIYVYRCLKRFYLFPTVLFVHFNFNMMSKYFPSFEKCHAFSWKSNT